MSDRTHCKNGHSLEGNAYVRPNGWVTCRQCKRESYARRALGNARVPNQEKDTCIRGHALTPENVRMRRGRRECILCARVRSRSRATGAPKGRPPWVPTDEDRQMILAAIEAGATMTDAASAVGTSEKTLERYLKQHPDFATQLREARPKKHNYTGGCRCADCRRRNALTKRRWAERQEVVRVHGPGGYTNYGCRCDTCTAAHRADMAARSLDSGRWEAERHGVQWTGPDLEIATRPDLSITEAARMLGRTYNSVASMRRRATNDPKTRTLLGIPVPSRTTDHGVSLAPLSD